jgi:hypothetical protein
MVYRREPAGMATGNIAKVRKMGNPIEIYLRFAHNLKAFIEVYNSLLNRSYDLFSFILRQT